MSRHPFSRHKRRRRQRMPNPRAGFTLLDPMGCASIQLGAEWDPEAQEHERLADYVRRMENDQRDA